MQVKCCGDTSVRHTGVGGFNSPHLLEIDALQGASTDRISPQCVISRCTGESAACRVTSAVASTAPAMKRKGFS